MPPFTREESEQALLELHKDWTLKDYWLERFFLFKSFQESLDFVNKVGKLAEEEWHHPDITIQYNKVTLKLWTHAIGGLSENDFILSAKIDKL